MKVAMELVHNVGELTGVGPITNLIKLIIDAASTARNQERVCLDFVEWLKIMEGLLTPLLEGSKLMERPEARALLMRLEESLLQAYELVINYKERSYPYRFVMGSNIAQSFQNKRNEIKDYILFIPLITLFVDQTIIYRVDTRSLIQDKEEEEEMDQNDKEENTEQGNKMEEEKGRGGKEKEEDNKIDLLLRVLTFIILLILLVIFRVLLLLLIVPILLLILPISPRGDGSAQGGHALPGPGPSHRINHSRRSKYPAVVTEMDKSIDDGGKLPNCGKKNEPTMVAATVVLIVGDTGLCECNGCVDKIRDTLFKSTGVRKVGVDTDKNQVTVTGTNMDIDNLRKKLGNKVHRPVKVMQASRD